MNSVCTQTTDSTLDYLHELFAAATHDASAAMSRWTNGLVRLTLDKIEELPLGGVCEELGIGFEPLNMVVLSLMEEPGGTMVLTFDDPNGRQLAATLVGQKPSEGDEWSELEISALSETGNILSCAYMNALTQFLDHQLVPSPPQFIRDFGACVLEQAFAAQAQMSDNITICRTTFHCEGKELSWDMFFVPTREMREAMENVLEEKTRS